MIGGTTDPAGRARKQLHRLFPDDPELSGAVSWARETLRSAALEPSTAPLRSMRALRRADRRLGVVAARYLVEEAAGRAPARRRRPLNPHLE